MRITHTEQQIHDLQRRLEVLAEQAENELRQKLREARAVVADLEMQLSQVTGRPSASQVRAAQSFAPITDDQLEPQILFILQQQGQLGASTREIATKLNQDPARIRQFIKRYPRALRRSGRGNGTRFYLPDSTQDDHDRKFFESAFK